MRIFISNDSFKPHIITFVALYIQHNPLDFSQYRSLTKKNLRNRFVAVIRSHCKFYETISIVVHALLSASRKFESSQAGLCAPLLSNVKLYPQNNFIKATKTRQQSQPVMTSRSRKENSRSHEGLLERVLLGMLAVLLRHVKSYRVQHDIAIHVLFVLIVADRLGK